MVTPVRPEPGVTAQGRADARARSGSSAVVDALDRPLDKAAADVEAGPLDVAGEVQHHARPNTAPWCSRRRSTSSPATSSRWCCRSASRRRSRCRRSRSTARCGGSIRRRSSISSISAASPIAGSSPEILVRVRDGTVTIRPIAGTRPRGATPHEDKALEDELLADPKERAEHLMLLDLGRNDVGRVAQIGTVNVTDQFFIERYSHVMHIVSNVEGKLADGPRRARCAGRGLSGRHRVGRAQGARDADHRRAGEGEARPLRRLRRLFLGRRRDGQLHRAAHRADQGRHDVRAGRRRHRRRQRSRRASRPNASTRPRRCSAPPKRRAASPARPDAGSRALRRRCLTAGAPSKTRNVLRETARS